MAKILIAGEDYTAVQNVAASVMAEGHFVIEEVNGLDAYETALREQPDLVFLETQMPVFSGFEACVLLRQDPEIPKDLPIIMLTQEPLDARKMEQILATDQLPKRHLSVDIREMLTRYLGAKAGRTPVRQRA